MNIEEFSGKKFSRLTVVSEHGRLWLCKCDCGTVKMIKKKGVKSSNIRSCGCLHDEFIRNLNKSHGNTVGRKRSPEYVSWLEMKSRCLNPSKGCYKNYGGRGIKICERWINSFPNFLLDMGKKPTQKHTLDRMNVNGNYEPLNCRWATRAEQCENRRNIKLFEINGRMQTVTKWGMEAGINVSTLKARIRRGATIQEAISK